MCERFYAPVIARLQCTSCYFGTMKHERISIPSRYSRRNITLYQLDSTPCPAFSCCIARLPSVLISFADTKGLLGLDMKINIPSVTFFIVTILTYSSPLVSPAPPPAPAPNDPKGQCALNFSTYRYVPIGECGIVQEDISNWGSGDGFPTTLCCRNALTVLSQALALQAHNSPPPAPLFVSQDQWRTCSNSFHPQQGMSTHSCGFDNLYFGSSNCSSFTLQAVQGLQQYQDALDKCQHFDHPFDQSCANCTSAILRMRDSLYNQAGVNDNTERAICGMVAVISVAAGQQDGPSITDKFLRCLPTLTKNDQSGSGFLKGSWAKLLLSVLLAIIGITLIIILVKHVSKKKPPSSKPVQLKGITTWSGLYWFSKAEIENAISHGNQRCLGRGSAGEVYEGVLPSGQAVAIKHLSKSNSSDSFTREVEGLSRLRHPNLVCLFGCCMEDEERYLVYEFCANGNLAQHLLRRDIHLTWETRVKILRDCSFALKYLHHHIEGCVVHRNIKLTNILLTEDFQAKLSGFGLAKMLGMEESKVFTDVRGTVGYMNPEYMSNAKLTSASDIYSFGIVALQILSGQKVIELDLDATDQLTRKARDVSIGKRPLTDFEDPRLKGDVNKADFEAILQIAVLCASKSSKGRPTIEVVFEELHNIYKNTVAERKAKQDYESTSTTPTSKSSDLTPV